MLPSFDLSFPEMTGEATRALERSIETFCPARDVPFPAYAAAEIRTAIIAAARQSR
jgi:DNA-directed RNA polymerase specialized sigma subunit